MNFGFNALEEGGLRDDHREARAVENNTPVIP
jgi:hypothetical protein